MENQRCVQQVVVDYPFRDLVVYCGRLDPFTDQDSYRRCDRSSSNVEFRSYMYHQDQKEYIRGQDHLGGPITTLSVSAQACTCQFAPTQKSPGMASSMRFRKLTGSVDLALCQQTLRTEDLQCRRACTTAHKAVRPGTSFLVKLA